MKSASLKLKLLQAGLEQLGLNQYAKAVRNIIAQHERFKNIQIGEPTDQEAEQEIPSQLQPEHWVSKDGTIIPELNGFKLRLKNVDYNYNVTFENGIYDAAELWSGPWTMVVAVTPTYLVAINPQREDGKSWLGLEDGVPYASLWVRPMESSDLSRARFQNIRIEDLAKQQAEQIARSENISEITEVEGEEATDCTSNGIVKWQEAGYAVVLMDSQDNGIFDQVVICKPDDKQSESKINYEDQKFLDAAKYIFMSDQDLTNYILDNLDSIPAQLQISLFEMINYSDLIAQYTDQEEVMQRVINNWKKYRDHHPVNILAQNKNITERIANQILQEGSSRQRALLALNPGITENIIRYFYTEDTLFRQNLALNSNLPEWAMLELANDDEVAVRELLAKREDLPETVQQALLQNANAAIIFSLAGRYSTTPENLLEIAKWAWNPGGKNSLSLSVSVARYLSSNPKLPTEAILHLISIPLIDSLTLTNLANHRNANEQIIDKIIDLEPVNIEYPTEMVERILENSRHTTTQNWAHFKTIQEKVDQILEQNPEPF